MVGVIGCDVRARKDSEQRIQDEGHQRSYGQGDSLADPPEGHQHDDGGHLLAFRRNPFRGRHDQHQDKQAQTAQKDNQLLFQNKLQFIHRLKV